MTTTPTASIETTRRHSAAVYLLLLAGPIVASNISRTVMSFVDFVMVSQLGTEAQAAIVPAGILVFCISGFGIGLTSGINTLASQSLGRQRPADCSGYGWQGLYLSLLLGLIALPAWWLIEPLFIWVDHGPKVTELEIEYGKISVLGVAPAVAVAALSNFFTGIHRPRISMVATLLSNTFNVVGNYVLIFGHWGFPKMGVAGAAWVTVAATILHAGILLVWMVLPYYTQAFDTRVTWRPNPGKLMHIVRVGGPVGIMFLGDLVAWTIFTIFLIGRFGPVHLAANNITFKITEISFMPAVGIGVAITASVGKAIGANQIKLATRYVRWGMIFILTYMCLTGLIMLLFRHQLPALMIKGPADEVVAVASVLLITAATFQMFDGLVITFAAALRGAGDTTWQALVWIGSCGGILVGGGFVIAATMPKWGSLGPWLVATMHVIVVGAAFSLRYFFGPWRRMKLFND